MTTPLKLVTLRALVARELVALKPPTGPERRRGARAHARALLHAINEDLDEIDQEHRERTGRMQDSASRVVDVVLELSSFLYAAGAPHPIWRRWASVSAFGSHLAGDQGGAIAYAALAGEWPYLEHVSTRATPGRQLADTALLHVLGAVPASALSPPADAIGQAWHDLALSIPGRDHARTAAALGVLARDWIAALDDDWSRYAYRAFPLFDPMMCAAAALAAKGGFARAPEAESLGELERRALEPGLAEGWPDPMYPAVWKP